MGGIRRRLHRHADAAGSGAAQSHVRRSKTEPAKRNEPEQSAHRPRRMNFNDQRALERLPDQIAALQARVAELNAVMADPDLFTRDRARFLTTTKSLAMARDELAAAEERWLTLE